MISFREYQNILIEDFKPVVSKNPQGTISYSHSVGDHKVHTHFIPRGAEGSGGDGDYDVHFTRSGPDGKSSGFDRRGMGKISGGDRVRMMHGVMKSIHHFVGEHKPKSITGIGNTKKKNDTFSGMMGHFGKKAGGKVSGNTIRFSAGVCPGEHWGPPFHDGDFYKWLEGVAAVYAVNKDPKLDALMDKAVAVIVKAQREDGYIHTPVIIEEKNKGVDSHKAQKETVIGTEVGGANEVGAFANRLNFETYNLGHLMMAGCIHYRATGKKTLFNAAIKATDFLCHFYETASAELARNAICPSHYVS